MSEEPCIEVDRVAVSLSADKKSLFMSFGSRADLTVMLDAEDVDQMFFALAEWRGEMLPPHPSAYATPPQVMAIADPSWHVEREMIRGGSLLHIRHYGFGWLSFWLSRRAATKLASSLQSYAEVDDAASHSKN